jgi:hypothetical protein
VFVPAVREHDDLARVRARGLLQHEFQRRKNLSPTEIGPERGDVRSLGRLVATRGWREGGWNIEPSRY